jgi:hypothetical protein
MKNGASSFLLHRDKESFRNLVDRTATQAGFYTPLMEKDYYLTFILSRVNELSPDLIFKGGTCLNLYGSIPRSLLRIDACEILSM